MEKNPPIPRMGRGFEGSTSAQNRQRLAQATPEPCARPSPSQNPERVKHISPGQSEQRASPWVEPPLAFSL
jgi:hypothetical protein